MLNVKLHCIYTKQYTLKSQNVLKETQNTKRNIVSNADEKGKILRPANGRESHRRGYPENQPAKENEQTFNVIFT